MFKSLDTENLSGNRLVNLRGRVQKRTPAAAHAEIIQ
jgi:hypothetical protein